MKKYIYNLFALVALFGVFVAPIAHAATDVTGDVCNKAMARDSAVCRTKPTTNPLTGPNGLLIKVGKVIGVIGGIAAVIVLMLSGLRYILSDGDAAQAASAKRGIIFSLIGLIVIVAAASIISLFLGSGYLG